MPDVELARLAGRADLCRLLAACFYEPGPEFAEERLFDSLLAAARLVDPAMAQLAEGMSRHFETQPLDDLRVDYTALFLHPTMPRALPYESSWIDTQDAIARQEAIDAVLRFYREHGFDVDEGFRDLPDHVAAELEFLYTLLFREAGARNARDDAGRRAAAGIRHAFLERHLGRWIHRFAEALQAGADTSFYRDLGALTEAFVTDELSQP